MFSPLTDGYALSEIGDLPTDAFFWEEYNDSFIREWATHVYVFKLEGWEKSKGVKHEIEFCERIGKPVIYIDPSE